MPKLPVPTEHQECVLLARYLMILKRQGKVEQYAHLVNELKSKKGKKPDWALLRSRKAEGWRSGVPDYLIVFKHKTIFIEMKRKKGGVVSPAQKAWVEAINESGGNAYICRGFEEAKEVIDKELNECKK